MENLTDEQQKRIALLDAFEAKTAPEREFAMPGLISTNRNTAKNGCNCSPAWKQPVAICTTRLKG
jgi:hypothetical protein